MPFTPQDTLDSKRRLAHALRGNMGQQILPNWASGLAYMLNQYNAGSLDRQATEAEQKNAQIAVHEIAQALKVNNGQASIPLRPGEMPQMQSPQGQSLAATLMRSKAGQNKLHGSTIWLDTDEGPVPGHMTQEGQFQQLNLPQGASGFLLPGSQAAFDPGSIDRRRNSEREEDREDIPVAVEREGQLANARVSGGSGGVNLTPAQQAIDTEFGQQYAEFVSGGGFADLDKQIQQLEGVLSQLNSGANNLTGPVVGSTPQWLEARINPEATNVREQVEEVVQRNLRLILGAQFTEEEGKRLIARAYNRSLDEKTNAERVGRLLEQMKSAAEAKKAAALYYEQNGTLQGFQGKMPTLSDFEQAIESGSNNVIEVDW